MAAGGSGLGVALAGAFLRDVDAAVDLVAMAAGALVGYVAGLLKALVDLLVVLVGDSMSFRCRRVRIPVCSAGPVRRCTPRAPMAGPVTTSARTSAWSASSARPPRNGPPTTRHRCGGAVASTNPLTT